VVVFYPDAEAGAEEGGADLLAGGGAEPVGVCAEVGDGFGDGGAEFVGAGLGSQAGGDGVQALAGGDEVCQEVGVGVAVDVGGHCVVGESQGQAAAFGFDGLEGALGMLSSFFQLGLLVGVGDEEVEGGGVGQGEEGVFNSVDECLSRRCCSNQSDNVSIRIVYSFFLFLWELIL